MKVNGENPSLVDIIMPTKLTSNGTKLDLNNADLLGCTIVSDDITVRRFLVVQTFQIILVEPDSTRLGWGVVTFRYYFNFNILYKKYFLKCITTRFGD